MTLMEALAMEYLDKLLDVERAKDVDPSIVDPKERYRVRELRYMLTHAGFGYVCKHIEENVDEAVFSTAPGSPEESDILGEAVCFIHTYTHS